jgi:hypothetical protein
MGVDTGLGVGELRVTHGFDGGELAGVNELGIDFFVGYVDLIDNYDGLGVVPHVRV